MRTVWPAALVCVFAAGAPAGAQAAFPGENGRILFERFVDGPNADILAINPDGSDPVNLTNSPEREDAPAVSADGTRIAFVRDFDIWVMNIDGSGQVNLTNDPGNGQPSDLDPAFSPDGRRVVYARDTNGQGTPDEIFAAATDGSAPVNLTDNGNDLDASPTVSPDGTRIAWVRNESGPAGADEVFAMNADGSSPVNLTNFATNLFTTDPDYSPDGSRIAFDHDDDVWEMNADGSNQENLMPGPMLDGSDPAYAPDGTRIAFSRDTGGGPTIDEIFTIGPGPLVNVTNSPETDFAPAWAPRDLRAPETTLTEKPRKRSGRRRPRFAFESTEPGTFECRLDKREWEECSSPRKLRRLAARRHRFRVRATDLSGNTDTTPAKHRFRVLE